LKTGKFGKKNGKPKKAGVKAVLGKNGKNGKKIGKLKRRV
jgi:hypothetical protein